MTGPQFDDFREINARRACEGKCGHTIKVGDVIGWSRRFGQGYCPTCWDSWVAENQEADLVERNPDLQW